MQVLEFHFNPKVKKDIVFDTFCYEPENIYEKKVGSLYLVGFLKNALPQHKSFLDNLAKIIKERYYKSISVNAEKALKEGLKKANESLEKIAKDGDVSWLGNLSFAAISLKDYELSFAKVNDLKVVLLRKGQIMDIDQRIDREGIEPYPLKVFGNIISGNLAENDLILILTGEVFETFLKEKVLDEIAEIDPFDQKKLKTALNKKRGVLSEISGICLLLYLSKESTPKEKEAFSPPRKIFSFKKVFSPILAFFQKLFKNPKLKTPRIKTPKMPKISTKIPLPKLKKIKLPDLKFDKKIVFNKISLSKKIILIISLIFFLVLGYFISDKMEKQKIKEYRAELEKVWEKVDEAETYLILAETNPQAENKANSLLKEAWDDLTPLINIVLTLPKDFASQVSSLEENILENLYRFNKLTEITEPELFFEFDAENFIPQKITIDSENIYCFTYHTKEISVINLSNKNQNIYTAPIENNKGINLAISLKDFILFFSRPDKVVPFENGEFKEQKTLESPSVDFLFISSSSYGNNLYFLEDKSGEIIKYPYLQNFEWEEPELWLDSQAKKTGNAKSIAVDGSVWVLTNENSIERYYIGENQEVLSLDFFPYPENIYKIFTSPNHSYLYLLEPIKSRVVLLKKTGEVFRQFQSEKFDNLIDFAVSENESSIYILNGLKIYKIEI